MSPPLSQVAGTALIFRRQAHISRLVETHSGNKIFLQLKNFI
jgi:hypothetical protein